MEAKSFSQLECPLLGLELLYGVNGSVRLAMRAAERVAAFSFFFIFFSFFFLLDGANDEASSGDRM